MDENNLSNFEIKADLTNVAKNAYKDFGHKPLCSTSNVISTVIDFFHNTVLYPMQKYNLYANNKLQKFSEELQSKAEKIPEENLVSPRVSILGPTIEGLKYNLDEEYIKNYFTNILVSDMDNRKQNKVLPSYVEIVKQLSKSDAEILQFIKENNIDNDPIIKLKYNFAEGGFVYVSNNIGLINDNDTIIIDAIVIDNLSRLQLIEANFNESLKNDSIYDNAFEKIKKSDEFNILPPTVKELSFSKGLLKVTRFGKNFIDICLS